MKKMIVAVAVIAVLGASGLALAQGWGRGAERGYGPGMSGYGPSNPAPWCLGLKADPGQLGPEDRAKLRDSRRGNRGSGKAYGMRGGMGYGPGFGMGYGPGSPKQAE